MGNYPILRKKDSLLKIAFADPPLGSGFSNDFSYPNIGILYLISYINRKFSSEVDCLYLESFLCLKDHISKVVDYRPDIYGISFSSFHRNQAYDTLKKLRTYLPNTVFLCGGPHATALPDEVLQNSPTDACVIGEGEETLTEIVQHMLNGDKKDDVLSVQGSIVKGLDRKYFKGLRPLIDNLDLIPLPEWNRIIPKRYPGLHYYKNRNQGCILPSRGCPYRCIFCSNPVWQGYSKKVRFRSANNILYEIGILKRMGIREIYLKSDSLNCNLAWAKSVLNTFSQSSIINDMTFQCDLRADQIDAELTFLLRNANMWLVHIGIESISSRVLEGISKGITFDQVINALKLLKKEHIKVKANMTIYHLWPEGDNFVCENSAEVEKSYNFIKKMYKEKMISYNTWQLIKPIPGSKLYKLLYYKQMIRDFDNIYRDDRISINRIGIKDEEIKKWLRYGIVLKNVNLIKNSPLSLFKNSTRSLRAFRSFISMLK